ncbi:hypothetical protein [Pseudonocardia asaccharolytica]|uniref:Uncharacterized protein n=1 Tax=Pseudonocardia asaccharolytica DSM 44247 = NBRC 16224 TaxID=1123024 RepID=A0A511CV62_9PSEU|nr:hypothetical protein [Pseudonocardia asaccharolytica]GEL16460.1 hypothetical protein PA7_02970 [Pseudonocardia asaccharolytica DSM 44247 = NBRC 16224]
MTTVPSGGSAGPWSIPPLFADLVDDISLLLPRMLAPGVDAVVARYLSARDGRYGGMIGQLVCPVSRLSALVTELARLAPNRPVDLSLVVDTGLGAVPKALSMVLSRSGLLTPRTVETAAPPDVDAVWLERVSEFVPEDVLPVIEPRRPLSGNPAEIDAWLDAVRRVAENGCAPKLRCGGPRPSDVPSDAEVARFIEVVVEAGCGFTVLGVNQVVRPAAEDGAQHGMLNLLVTVARALHAGDIATALRCTDGEVLARELAGLSERAVLDVRGLLSRCGADPEPAPADAFAGLGLLA